jgi:endonuclease
VSRLNEGFDRHAIAAQVGVTPGQVTAVKSHVSMGTYKNDGGDEIEGEIADAVDTAFGLEHDLQMALRRSIEQLEPGLTIIDGGREQTVASGRIDITAHDKDGSTVVIELKAGPADRDAIGQVLSYIGDLTDASAQVRGIVVAREFSSRAVAAARAAPNLRLVRYSFRFSFEMVSTASLKVSSPS